MNPNSAHLKAPDYIPVPEYKPALQVIESEKITEP